MNAVLIVTQGRLADELLAAAETIAGTLPRFRALSLEWNVGLEGARALIAREIAALDDGTGVLVLTDMYGSTPTNAALAEAVPGRIAILAGVNLPMVLRLGCSSAPPDSVDETARWLEIKARRSISRARGLPRADGGRPADGGRRSDDGGRRSDDGGRRSDDGD
jgi:PTS system mannose-specific IIA component